MPRPDRALSRFLRPALLALLVLPALGPRVAGAEDEDAQFEAWKKTVKHPVLRVRSVDKPPKIDGKLDELYEQKATPVSLVLISGKKTPPVFNTTAWLLCDKQYLYVFTRCQTPFPDAVLAKITERDNNIFHDETIELFLDPTNSREDCYFHIMVNAIGTTGDIRNNSDPSWNPRLTVKTARDAKTAWLMEMRIPYVDLDIRAGKLNKVWSCNINRTARPEPKPPLGIDDVEIEDTAWSPTFTDSSHCPQMFGYLWLDAGEVVNTTQADVVRATVDLRDQRPEQAQELNALPLDEGVDEKAIVEEYAVRRPERFAFTAKPRVTRAGDRITIAFEAETFGDATVAIEEPDGLIVRHLASGVLGPNAPEPFQKDSLKQTVVWDGKDDTGRYLDDKDSLRVRVSLGLRPQFERTLFWSPHKRWGTSVPMIRATAEGVYVFDNNQNSQLRLFGHDGTYLRTVYPFPANRLHLVEGIQSKIFPHDGRRWPVKYSHIQCTLLTTADLRYGMFWPTGGKEGEFASAMEIVPGVPDRIYLLGARLNRLSGDGSTSGKPLQGPQTCFQSGTFAPPHASPWSAAASPDGKWLYLTGFLAGGDALHGVARMDPSGDKEPELWAGVLRRNEFGSTSKRFKMPTSVDCDAQGRVYVADYLNDRVQVLDPDGNYVATVRTIRPSEIRINRKTGEIYVFSWPVPNYFGDRFRNSQEGTLTRFAALGDGTAEPKTISKSTFPCERPGDRYRATSAEIDFHTDPPTVWIAPIIRGGNWEPLQIKLYELADGALKPKRDFAEDIRKSVWWFKSPGELRQRLYFDPKTRSLYVGEYTRPHAVHCKWFKEMLRVDAESGKVSPVRLPMDAEDVAFDIEGRVYLRNPDADFIARFDPATWREIPFDYGEERDTFISGLVVPGISDGGAMSGGFSVSPRGRIVVHCRWPLEEKGADTLQKVPDEKNANDQIRKHAPQIFPGRYVEHELHVFDQHGQWVYKDALPGIERTDGVNIDSDDYLYMTVNQTRNANGKRYFNDISCSYLKAKAGQARILTTAAARVPLPPSEIPKREADLVGHRLGAAWVEGAEWIHGAVGLNGRSVDNERIGRNCDCSAKSRGDLDFFRRSFVTEVDHYSVIVLDTNGNPIVRIGRYGNADDGKPLNSAGGPEGARAIGGDEVAIFHAMNLVVHSDRRLFIADVGNERILSVKLDYFANETINLKSVPDEAPPQE
ncbi:MAG: hypothetical protein L6R28_10205 [Planctomycetes bacterium]|nr:hypothetical protein [Planctomycetota bacterium]